MPKYLKFIEALEKNDLNEIRNLCNKIPLKRKMKKLDNNLLNIIVEKASYKALQLLYRESRAFEYYLNELLASRVSDENDSRLKYIYINDEYYRFLKDLDLTSSKKGYFFALFLEKDLDKAKDLIDAPSDLDSILPEYSEEFIIKNVDKLLQLNLDNRQYIELLLTARRDNEIQENLNKETAFIILMTPKRVSKRLIKKALRYLNDHEKLYVLKSYNISPDKRKLIRRSIRDKYLRLELFKDEELEKEFLEDYKENLKRDSHKIVKLALKYERLDILKELIDLNFNFSRYLNTIFESSPKIIELFLKEGFKLRDQSSLIKAIFKLNLDTVKKIFETHREEINLLEKREFMRFVSLHTNLDKEHLEFLIKELPRHLDSSMLEGFFLNFEQKNFLTSVKLMLDKNPRAFLEARLHTLEVIKNLIETRKLKEFILLTKKEDILKRNFMERVAGRTEIIEYDLDNEDKEYSHKCLALLINNEFSMRDLKAALNDESLFQKVSKYLINKKKRRI